MYKSHRKNRNPENILLTFKSLDYKMIQLTFKKKLILQYYISVLPSKSSLIKKNLKH